MNLHNTLQTSFKLIGRDWGDNMSDVEKPESEDVQFDDDDTNMDLDQEDSMVWDTSEQQPTPVMIDDDTIQVDQEIEDNIQDWQMQEKENSMFDSVSVETTTHDSKLIKVNYAKTKKKYKPPKDLEIPDRCKQWQIDPNGNWVASQYIASIQAQILGYAQETLQSKKDEKKQQWSNWSNLPNTLKKREENIFEDKR